MIVGLYRLIAFCVWFGVMFAICTVLIAAALVVVLAVTAYGLVAPRRSPASALRALAANTSAAVDHVKALKPT